MIVVAVGSVAVAVSAGHVGLRAAVGASEWAAPTHEGRWRRRRCCGRHCPAQVRIREEKKRKEKKNLSSCCQLKRVACMHAKSAQQVRLRWVLACREAWVVGAKACPVYARGYCPQ